MPRHFQLRSLASLQSPEDGLNQRVRYPSPDPGLTCRSAVMYPPFSAADVIVRFTGPVSASPGTVKEIQIRSATMPGTRIRFIWYCSAGIGIIFPVEERSRALAFIPGIRLRNKLRLICRIPGVQKFPECVREDQNLFLCRITGH